jgi:hypothetical protein
MTTSSITIITILKKKRILVMHEIEFEESGTREQLNIPKQMLMMSL